MLLSTKVCVCVTASASVSKRICMQRLPIPRGSRRLCVAAAPLALPTSGIWSQCDSDCVHGFDWSESIVHQSGALLRCKSHESGHAAFQNLT